MERVVLRQWIDSDLDPYSEMNSDPDVMRYFPALLTRSESEASLVRLRAAIDKHGWGLWQLKWMEHLRGSRD